MKSSDTAVLAVGMSLGVYAVLALVAAFISQSEAHAGSGCGVPSSSSACTLLLTDATQSEDER